MSIDHELLLNLGSNDRYSLKTLLELNEIEEDDEPTLLQHSPSVYQDMLIDICKSKKDVFKCLGLNIQSINAKIDQLQIYINNLNEHDCEFEAICLQETWLGNDHDTSLLAIKNYDLILKPYKATRHGGLAIYLKQNIQYEKLDNFIESPSNIWEGQFIKVLLPNDTHFILGNIYRPPRDNIENYTCFMEEFESVIKQFTGDVIICGDFNIDLLKISERNIINDFLENLLSNGLLPKITFPTRITRNSGTLIDNVLTKISNNFSNTTSGICAIRISDHLPYFVCLDYLTNENKHPKYVKVKNHSMHNIDCLKTYLTNAKIFEMLDNSDPSAVDSNYERFNEVLLKGIKLHMPTKLVKYNKYKHKKYTWITKGII